MKFNVDKCKVVHYGRDSIGYKYSLYGQQHEEATSEKDLGIVFPRTWKLGNSARMRTAKEVKFWVSSTELSSTKNLQCWYHCTSRW